MKLYFKLFAIVMLLFTCKHDKSEVKKRLVQTISEPKTNDSLEQPNNIPQIHKSRLLGKVNYKTDSLFILVESQYSSKPLYLNKECFESFKRMFDKAKNDGISLKIISGARNFEYQKGIWERKWQNYSELEAKKRTKKILEYSAMPTTSRHHWGTDIDINSLNNRYFNSGKGKKEYDWLIKNANTFGFYQVYTSKDNGRTGYNEEKWHWSYLPVASAYLNAYNRQITYKDIDGFLGSEYAEECHAIKDFVNGISEKAKAYGL